MEADNTTFNPYGTEKTYQGGGLEIKFGFRF